MTESFLFGVTLAIAIGPIALLIINLSMTAGLSAGLRSGLGAALADLSYGLLAFLGAGSIRAWLAESEDIIRVCASVVLTLLGLYMVWSAVRSFGKSQLPAVIEGNPLISTYVLTISNPLTLLLFIGFFGVISREGEVAPVLLAVSLFLGSLLIQSLLALGGGLLAGVIKDPRILSGLNVASACGIVGFGLYGLFR